MNTTYFWARKYMNSTYLGLYGAKGFATHVLLDKLWDSKKSSVGYVPFFAGLMMHSTCLDVQTTQHNGLHHKMKGLEAISLGTPGDAMPSGVQVSILAGCPIERFSGQGQQNVVPKGTPFEPQGGMAHQF